MNKKSQREVIGQSYRRNLIKSSVSNASINNYDKLINKYGASALRPDILNKIEKQSTFTKYWFAIFIVLGAVCLIFDFKGCWFNVFDLYFVMINIYLVAKGKLIGIYIGIAECVVYAYICYSTQLFGEVIKVMCISVPLNIYSIINWTISLKKKKKEKFVDSESNNDITIKRLTKIQYVYFILAFIGVAGLCYLLLRYGLKQEKALILGAISVAITIMGKILTAKRFMDSYAVYVIGNIICLGMWIETLIVSVFSVANVSMLVYYLACLTNDVYAYALWKNMYKEGAINGGFLLSKNVLHIKKIAKLKRAYKTLSWKKELNEK